MFHLFSRIALYLLPAWILTAVSAFSCSPSLFQIAIYSAAALFASAWLFWGLWRCLYLIPSDRKLLQSSSAFTVVVILLSFALLLATSLAFLTGPRHDYIAYTKQWSTILAGLDPWLGTTNAYGPLHNLFALPYKVNRLLPKQLFVLLVLATGACSAFFPLGVADRTTIEQRCFLFAALIASPFTLVTVALYGSNDALPASAMVLSIIGVLSFQGTKSRLLSGAVLAAGSMCKFYPLIIFPALFLRRPSFDWAFASGFAGLIAVVSSVSYRMWGDSIFIPLRFAGARPSKHLSIFNFLRNVIGLNLDSLSVPLALVFFALALYVMFKLGLGPLFGSILAFTAVLTFYKVGHQQFFLFYFLVTPYAIRYFLACSSLRVPRLSSAVFLWLGFLNLYQLEYSLSCGMWEWPARAFRFWGAIVYFALTTVVVMKILSKKSSGRQSSCDPPDLHH